MAGLRSNSFDLADLYPGSDEPAELRRSLTETARLAERQWLEHEHLQERVMELEDTLMNLSHGLSGMRDELRDSINGLTKIVEIDQAKRARTFAIIMGALSVATALASMLSKFL